MMNKKGEIIQERRRKGGRERKREIKTQAFTIRNTEYDTTQRNQVNRTFAVWLNREGDLPLNSGSTSRGASAAPRRQTVLSCTGKDRLMVTPYVENSLSHPRLRIMCTEYIFNIQRPEDEPPVWIFRKWKKEWGEKARSRKSLYIGRTLSNIFAIQRR